MLLKTTLICLLMLPSLALASERLAAEKVYQKAWCDRQGGVMEYRLRNGMRVDCLTDEYAVEVEFASKWAESVGQSLFYAKALGKKPAVLLIIESQKDWKFYGRLGYVAKEKGVTIWTIERKDLAVP